MARSAPKPERDDRACSRRNRTGVEAVPGSARVTDAAGPYSGAFRAGRDSAGVPPTPASTPPIQPVEAAPDVSTEPRLTYKEAGVDIEAQDKALAGASSAIRGSFTPGVLGDVGLFGGLFDPSKVGFQDAILVSSADGVGTKLEVAKRAGIYDTVGRDLVQHCINDILVQGARPLFFMDYAAMGKLDPDVVSALVSGCANACRDNGLALLGGETAEMPGLYQPGDFELVGFIVGAVQREHLIDGKGVEPGQVLLGLGSAGLHTNGYTLARRILFDLLGHELGDRPSELGGVSIQEALLAEHRSYLDLLWPLIQEKRIAAMAHITGGGLPGNVCRVLGDTDAIIERSSWTVPPLFQMMVDGGKLESSEAHKAFNMGIGMVLVVRPDDVTAVRSALEAAGEDVFELGTTVAGSGKVELR